MAEPEKDILTQLAELDDEMWDITTPGWRIQVGRLRVERRWGSQTIAKIVIGFNATLWVIGAILIIIGEPVGELGIAMVVGATFSMGTFMTELWTQTTDHEQDVASSAVEERIAELRARRKALLAKLSPPEGDK